MKRIVVLATLLAMVLGSAVMASAAELTATGSWYIAGIWQDGNSLDRNKNNKADNAQENDFDVFQRLRTVFNFTANENLKGVIQTEIGTSKWGEPGKGADLGADDTVIEVKHAYINFVWPNTDVSITAGVMPLLLPAGAAGSAILDDDMGAIVVSAPISENVGLLLGWARPVSNLSTDDDGDTDGTNGDVAFAAVPLTFDGVSATPYFAYLYSGDNMAAANGGFDSLDTINANKGVSDSGVDAWWAGASFNMTLLDPFTIDASFVYGSAKGVRDDSDRSGWLADLAVDYTGLDSVTPELFFSYSTGEDGNASENNDSERLPTISGDYSFGTTFFSSGGMVPDQGLQDMNTQLGYWALGVSLKNFSFLEGLSHTFTIMYAKGTNDSDIATNSNTNIVDFGRTLTDEDSIWEFSLVNKYKIYDELTATLGLSYIAQDLDEDTWNVAGANHDATDAARVVLGLNYAF